MTASIVCLSRDRLGRRVFLAIVFNAYAVCYAAVFDFLVYRHYDTGGSNVFGLSTEAAGVIGLVVVSVMVLLFVFWVLPRIPRDNPKFCWTDYSLVAAVSFACVFASGFWPVSVVSASGSCCVPFVLASAVMWVGFPMVCRSINELMFNADVEHGLELMTAEMKVRRAAIDEARRLRHDQRFHRVQLDEYLRCGQYERARTYLKALGDEAAAGPTGGILWCEDETVNAILSGTARLAAEKGVGFSAEVGISRKIALPDIDLVAVFANLIDNAIEAAGKIGTGDRCRAEGPSGANGPRATPHVRVAIRQRAHGIGLTVTNPVPEGFSLSSKGLPCDEPGVGMESVRRVVERCAGKWMYGLTDGVLSCQVVLMVEDNG